MKIAVIGSRNADLSNYSLLDKNFPQGCTEIISGGAQGADALAERYAREHNIPLRIILPDYGAHGRSAPILRNIEIIEASDYVLAMWDGVSRGTGFVLSECLKRQKPLKVIPIPIKRSCGQNT